MTELDSERHRQSRRLVALKRAIEETFKREDWIELGYTTNTYEAIENHPRLLRSLFFGDEDYGACVFGMLKHILDKAPENATLIASIPKVAAWIKENEPAVYADLYQGPLVVKATLEVIQGAQEVEVESHIRRIRDALTDDPELAIGQTKELLETVLKLVLGEFGNHEGDDFPKLLKRAQATLGLDPKDVDGATPGSESFRRLLGALAQIALSVNEMRKLYGTGHGKARAPKLDRAAAHLIVGAGASLAAYLMERHRDRGRDPKPDLAASKNLNREISR